MNYYFAYGLSISTEIDFPELYVSNPVETPDVRVNTGKIPEQMAEKIQKDQSCLYITSTDYLLHINNVASYYVANGTEIIIEPFEGGDEKTLRVFFLSNAMAAILYQRKSIPLHASAISDTDGIVLFMGDSGAGKSTTIATLQAKGYDVFSDDVCVPVKTPEGLSAYAAYPMTKLWKDSFERAGIGEHDEETRIRPDMEKFGKHFNESFATEARLIKKIFILQKDDTAGFQYTPIKGIEAFKQLQKYAYRLEYIEEMKLIQDYFSVISALANQIPTILVSRPSQVDTLKQVIDLIESHLDEKR